jgi:hypothetical protein
MRDRAASGTISRLSSIGAAAQADIPFLEGLAKDRAPTVRERAQQLLKYIPGTDSAQGRLRDLVARTKVSAAGLLRRRTKLTLELPANLQAAPPAASAVEAGRRWAAGEYAGVGLDAMAAAFGLPIPDMIAAAADDAPLLALFARQASIERRFEVLAAIVREHGVDAWIDAIETGNGADGAGRGATVELPDDATAEQWCAAALAPELWPALPSFAHLDRLYGFLSRPLPPAQARALLRSRAFAAIANVASSPGVIGPTCLAIAALVPSSLAIRIAAGIRRVTHRRDIAGRPFPRLPRASRPPTLLSRTLSPMTTAVLRMPAEQVHADELAVLGAPMISRVRRTGNFLRKRS